MVLKLGTSNLVLPGTKKDFPAEFQSGSRLFYYSTLFNSIELNSTFYKVPKHSTFCKWRDDVTEEFKFSIKLWREITHAKKLNYITSDVSSFMQSSQGLGVRKGSLLIQFPASVTVEYQDHVEKLLDEICDHDDEPAWQLCVEFRHPSWYDESVYEMLHFRNAAPVFHDIHASRTPLTIASRWRTIYLRFHGPLGNYRGDYSEDMLQQYAAQINDWQEHGKDVYAYFNNTIGNAFQNARLLQKLTRD